ncbi:hypothetical protein Tco_0571035 [Tanacetum coccineum]
MWIDCLTALEMKYDTWVLDQDMIPVEAEFFLNSAKLDSVVDFYVGERLGLLFARSSGSGIWTNHFVNEFAQMHESNLSNDEDGFGFWARKVIGEEGCSVTKGQRGKIQLCLVSDIVIKINYLLTAFAFAWLSLCFAFVVADEDMSPLAVEDLHQLKIYCLMFI